MNRKDLRASTFVGQNWEIPVIYPLAEQNLENRLFKYSNESNYWVSGIQIPHHCTMTDCVLTLLIVEFQKLHHHPWLLTKFYSKVVLKNCQSHLASYQ